MQLCVNNIVHSNCCHVPVMSSMSDQSCIMCHCMENTCSVFDQIMGTRIFSNLSLINDNHPASGLILNFISTITTGHLIKRMFFFNLIYFYQDRTQLIGYKVLYWVEELWISSTARVTPYSSDRLSGIFYIPGDRIQYIGPRFLRYHPKVCTVGLALHFLPEILPWI